MSKDRHLGFEHMVELWQQATAPLRPTPTEMRLFEEWLSRVPQPPGARMLILGCTAELRDLALARGMTPVSCDFNRGVWEALSRLMRQRGAEEFLEMNWLQIPEDRRYDVITGDGSLSMLPPDQIEPMLRKMAALLKPTGVAVFRAGVRTCRRGMEEFPRAAEEHRRGRLNMPLYCYLLLLGTHLRCEHHPELTHGEMWEQVLCPFLTESERAQVRPWLSGIKVYYPEKADFDRMCSRHFQLADAVESIGPGYWGCAFTYTLLPKSAAP